MLVFVCQKLKRYEPVLCGADADAELELVRLLSPGMSALASDELYVGTAGQVKRIFEENPETAANIYFLIPADESERAELAALGGHYIFLSGEADAVQVFNELQTMSIRLLKWEMEFERTIYRHGSAQDAADISRPYVQGLTVVWNGNYNLISLPGDDGEEELSRLIPHIRAGAFTQCCVEATLDYTRVRSYDVDAVTEMELPDGDKVFCLVHHVFKAGEHAYSIALFSDSKAYLTEKRYVVSWYFSKLETLLLSNTEESAADNVFESFLRSIVDGSVSESKVIMERATELGLPIEQEYLFYVVRLKKFSMTKARFFIEAMRQTLPYEPMIIYREHICILKRTNIPKCKTHNGQLSFEIHLENYDAVCGISRKLSTLLDSRIAYYQACVALSYGLADPVHKSDMPRVFYYKDYAYYHMLELYEKSSGSLYSVLPGNIQAFYAENRDDEECMKVISAYIRNGMSSSAAAAELCVHRNTVINRINRIKDEYAIDLRTGEAVFGVMLMLDLRQYEEVFRGKKGKLPEPIFQTDA